MSGVKVSQKEELVSRSGEKDEIGRVKVSTRTTIERSNKCGNAGVVNNYACASQGGQLGENDLMMSDRDFDTYQRASLESSTVNSIDFEAEDEKGYVGFEKGLANTANVNL